MLAGFVDGGLVEDRKAGADVEVFRRLQAEGAGVVCRGVAAVEEGNGGEVETPVGHDACVEHGGEVVGAGQLEIEAGEEHALEVADVFLFGGEDQLEEDGGIFFGAGESDDALGEEVVRTEAEGAHDVEGTDDIGHEVFGLLVVAQVVAQQFVVLGGKFGRGQRAETFEEFVGVEESSTRSFGEFETFRRVDFPEGAQDAVAESFLGVSEDIKTANPRDSGDGCQNDDKNGPGEKVVLSGCARVGVFTAIHVRIVFRRALSRGVDGGMKSQCL